MHGGRHSDLKHCSKAKFHWYQNTSNSLLDTRISVHPSVCLMVLHLYRRCYPPWIWKRVGLKSSGQRLISLKRKSNIKFVILSNTNTKFCPFSFFKKCISSTNFRDFFHYDTKSFFFFFFF